MKTRTKISLAASAAAPLGVLLLILFVVLAATAVLSDDDSDTTGAIGITPVLCVAPIGRAGTLDAEQTANAAAIVAVGKARKVPQYGWVIALATALQESGLRNLTYGDRDSLGLFQQRPSSGWGTPAQVRDVRYAATAFYGGKDVPPNNPGLLDIPGWQAMPVTVAAQAVQHSAFPDAYADDELTARAAVTAITGAHTDACAEEPPPTTDAGRMVAVAVDQVGKPYVWGGIGPDGFDCSGLIVYSWQQIGYRLPVRVARDMYRTAVPIAPADAQPGDMIFSEFGSRGLSTDEPGHVLIVVRPGTAVEAYTTGQPVRVRAYNPADPEYRFGRFPSSALTKIR
jgi:peptidoglycan DL-endopeptidase CwlO